MTTETLDMPIKAADHLDFKGLLTNLKEQSLLKKDYVVPSNLVRMDNGLLVVPNSNGGLYMPNEVMHQHLAAKLRIPMDYYRRMLADAPVLLENNINTWLGKSSERGLFRTFETPTGNIARGMLSDTYKAIDNYDVLIAVFKAIEASGMAGRVQISDCAITEKKLYIRITNPDIEGKDYEFLRNYLKDSPVGDGIMSGIIVTNSEVGWGAYNISGMAVIKSCSNGAIDKQGAFRKTHLGAKLEEGTIDWSADTRKKNIELVQSQAGDAIRHFLSEKYLSGIVTKIATAHQIVFENPYDAFKNVVKEVSKSVSFDEEIEQRMLSFFMNDGDTHGSGIFQALTRGAQLLDADKRYDLEVKAFELLPEMKKFDVPFLSKN